MIKGLGSDIIAVQRIAKAIQRGGEGFLRTVFTAKEIAYCRRYKASERHYAGRFAAKEAIVKAFGTGFRHGVTWTDIEITPDAAGKPEVTLSTHARELFGDDAILLTISHCQEYATATAIIVKRVVK